MLTSEMTAEDTRLGELYVRHASDAVRLAYLLTGIARWPRTSSRTRS